MRSDKLRKSINEESTNSDSFDDSYLHMEVETTCVLYDLAAMIQMELIEEAYQ
jgi:hypothetical protein